MADDNPTVESVYREMHECRQDIQKKLEEGELRMDGLHETIEKLEKSMSTLLSVTEEFVSIYRAGKGFFRVWGWIVMGIKGLAVIGAALGAAYVFLKTGHTPTK